MQQPEKPKNKTFLVRMRPEVRALLEVAAADQRRSMTSLIDESVREHLQPRYGALESRIQTFLMGVKK